MRIIREIGGLSGFGRIHEVELSDGRRAARKMFDPKGGEYPEDILDKLRKRFIREVRVQDLLGGDHIIEVWESQLEGPSPWYLMPLADESYSEQIKRDRAAGTISIGPLLQVLDALEKLHGLGYVHRDLKPENILYHDGRWKLADLGLVLPVSGDTILMTSHGSAWGSQLYAAPEQAIAFKDVTAAADVYSFGCILHDLNVGSLRVPYARQSGSGPLARVIERCTEAEPLRRFGSVVALRKSLIAALSAPPPGAQTESAEKWVAKLKDGTSFSVSEAREFVRFLSGASEHDMFAVLAFLGESWIRTLKEVCLESWSALASIYSEWVRSTEFDFNFCDVIVGRLEVFVEMGSMDTQAKAVMASAVLAFDHNRWYVMGRLVAMCGPGISESLAMRLAIDMRADGVEHMFARCIEAINARTEDFHPLIAEAIKG